MDSTLNIKTRTKWIIGGLVLVLAWLANHYYYVSTDIQTGHLIKQAKDLYGTRSAHKPGSTDNTAKKPSTYPQQHDLVIQENDNPHDELLYTAHLLNQAIQSGNEEQLLALLSSDIDINFDKSESIPAPIFLAIIANRHNMVEILMESGSKTSDERFKLHALNESVRANQYRLVDLFLTKYKLDPNIVSSGNETPLAIALRNKHFKIAQKLVDAGANLQTPRSNKLTLLHQAAHMGDMETLRFLLHNGADIHAKDKQQNTAFMSALSNGHLSTARFLFLYPNNKEDLASDRIASIYYSAVRQGNIELVTLLLELGMSPNLIKADEHPPTFIAINSRRPGILKLLLEHGVDPNSENKDRLSLLAQAAPYCTTCIDVLLKHGASIEFGGTSNQIKDGFQEAAPLIWSVGRYDSMKTLLDAGANVASVSSTNETALSKAVRTDNDSVRLLLKAGADPNQHSNRQWPALIHAFSFGDLSVLHLLIAAGADVNLGNAYGYTALMAAAQDGHIPKLETLLAAGANINQRSRRGWTALTEARYQANFDIADWLVKRGAIDPVNIGLRPLSTRNQLKLEIKVRD